jgi:citrate synthase
MRWFEIAERVEEVLREEKGLFPNLDFYSSIVYHLMGIPIRLYTPIFAASRLSGWCAHVLEQLADNRLIRPDADYVGPPPRPYVPLANR